MGSIQKYFREHFFSSILLLLIIATASISFYRFMIANDYLVMYEGECDPITEKCFVGCEDEECTQEYHYIEVIKYAPDLEEQCGQTIIDCEKANVCLAEDSQCSITYCDPEVNEGECEAINEGIENENASEQENINQTNL